MHGSIWRNDQQQVFLMCQGFLRTPGAFPAKVAWNGVNFGAMNLLEDFFVYGETVPREAVCALHLTVRHRQNLSSRSLCRLPMDSLATQLKSPCP